MSSSIITTPLSSTIGADGRTKNNPVLLQWVPGNVIATITSELHPMAASDNGVIYEENVNSIIAFPYYNKIKKRSDILRGGNWDKYRYFPLLRGMYEVPAKGDPVLLCTVGGQNFFLGPLNTENSPNWNNDLLQSTEMLNIPAGKGKTAFNYNKSFVRQRRRRLAKFPEGSPSNNLIENLDNPNASRGHTDLHGDLMLEGRHGNSIRIGSRFYNPYIFITNGIAPGNSQESLGDGNTIALIKKGTINQHFRPYVTQDDDGQEPYAVETFNFASDSGNDTNRTLLRASNLSEDGSKDQKPDLGFYNYDSHQMLFNSDRITLNSKVNNIFLSSGHKIHIGAKDDVTITAKNDLIFDAKYTYLGGMSKIHHYNQGLSDNDEDKDNKMPVAEPMVLGEQLYTILNELVDCLSAACFMSPFGGPLPLIDKMSIPIASADNPGLPTGGVDPLLKVPATRKGLGTIKDKLESIKSKFHFLENNDEQKNPPPAGDGAGNTTGGTVSGT